MSLMDLEPGLGVAGGSSESNQTEVLSILRPVNCLTRTWRSQRAPQEKFNHIQDLVTGLLEEHENTLVVSDHQWQLFENSMVNLIEADTDSVIEEEDWTRLIGTIQKVFGRTFSEIPEEYQVLTVITGPQASNWTFARKQLLTEGSECFQHIIRDGISSKLAEHSVEHAFFEEVTGCINLESLGHKNATAVIKYMDPKNKEVYSNSFDYRGICDVFDFAVIHKKWALLEAVHKFFNIKFNSLKKTLKSESSRTDFIKFLELQRQLVFNYPEYFDHRKTYSKLLVLAKGLNLDDTSNEVIEVILEALCDCYINDILGDDCLEAMLPLIQTLNSRTYLTSLEIPKQLMESYRNVNPNIPQKEKRLYEKIISTYEIYFHPNIYKDSPPVFALEQTKRSCQKTKEFVGLLRQIPRSFRGSYKDVKIINHCHYIRDAEPVKKTYTELLREASRNLAEYGLKEGQDYTFARVEHDYGWVDPTTKEEQTSLVEVEFPITPIVSDDGAGPS